MKKALLTLLLFSASLNGVYAQCKTCHLGQHDPNDTTANHKLSPNGSGSLGQSYIQQNVCGLNYVTATTATATRYSPPYSGFPATLVVAGLPVCYTVQKAFLYYGASYTEATPPATTATVTNPIPSTATYASTNVGQAGFVCWGETGTVTYRADVTAAISGNGTYKVSLNGFANAAWEVDGLTLVIIYTSPAAYSGSISLWDGCIAFVGGTTTNTYNGFTACAASTSASAFLCGGDMQSNVNGNANTQTINGSGVNTFTNNFWNTNVQAVPNLTSGQTTCVYSPYIGNAGDCWFWSVAGLYWQNTSCVVCSAGTMTVTPTQVNPTCGNNNGSITVGVTGGTAPYTYTWTPAVSTTSSATGLSAGTYSITVKDAGCNVTTVVVTLVTTSLSVSANVTANVACNGGATGSGSSTITGGTAPFTYVWTPTGGTNSSANGLTAGTYTVTVKDKNGCTGTASITITQPPLLTVTTTVTNIKCNGGTGSAVANPAGGTPAYAYAWTPAGGNASNATGLSVGTYTITVTDANGCIATATATITQPPALTATITNTPVKCNGGATGSATVTAGGGTPGYGYSWSPSGGNGSNATALTAGSYTVTVTDANGCIITASTTITQPPALTAAISNTPVKCNGGATGSATVTIGGGTPGYGYTWTPAGGNGSNATALTAGTYTVTVTDANGCIITASTTITQPPALTATITNTPVKCNGAATGSATVTVGGGTPGYNYSWAPSGGNGSNATALVAGSYTVTVTDANGCTITASTTITQPTALTATTTTTTATCGNPDGSATVTAGGGTPGYLYSWSPSGGNGSNATALVAGSYTVTVTDANGCTITAIANVPNAAAETVTISGSTNILCNGGNNGSITTTTTGGTPPYNYAWTPGGQTGANATGLTAGCYTVTVHDANGCTSTAGACLTEPTALTATTTTTPVLCNGGSTGSATVTANNGTPGYLYSWAPSGGNGSNATALSAGTYTVTVTDANGCSMTAAATVTQPTLLTVSTGGIVNVLCNGGNNGSATTIATGGTPAYNYTWSNGQTGNATGLTAGTYTVTATDANGCTATATATISEPTALTATTTTITSTCGKPNGSATVTVGGGTPGYLYSWSPSGGNGSNAIALSTGTYTVTVTDANGCTITASANVANATAETVTISGSTNVSCNGGANGSITTNTVGGTLPYNYAWTPGGQTNANATGLTAGCYTVTVHDANGCTSTAGACLTEPTALTATTTTTPVLCNGGSTGSATVTANNGTPGYLYSWAPSGGNGSNATALSAGTYTVTVTDANGCSMTAAATVTQPTLLTVSTGGIVNVLCNGGNNGSATTIATGGTPAYNYTWSNGQTGNATGLTAGTYTVTATDANGCTATATATISEPTALTATTTTITSTCGKPNGSATVTVGGGTPGYLYSWSPSGGNGSNAIALSTGTYTVTVTDANGCTITASANVANATAETVTISGSTNVSCNGGANGSITTNTVGGTLPYNYAWTPGGQTNANATGLTAGCYTVTVNDANGCTATASACITEPPLLTITTGAPANVLCNGNNNGSDLATATGGTGAYTYAWTTIPVQTNANATGLTAGSYTIQVTDANGCTATASTTITQPPALTLAAAGFPVTCNGGSDGQATAIPGGGTPPYAYAWSNGGTIANINSLSAGNYTITITDAHGCIYDTTVTVSQPAPIVVAFSADTINGCAPLCTGFMDASTDPGGVITHWSWSYSDGGSDTVQNPRHCFTTPGTYNVTLTVTDNHGCTSVLVIPNMITVYSAPVAAFSFGPQPTTITNPTINFTDKSTDAYGIAGWLWNFADPSNDLPGNVQNPNHTYGDTGTYCATLTVTNVHGCVDSITECLVISPQYELFIPNAFSPDGDGKNDIFQPKGQFVNNYKMYIFDRWGMLLFYSDDFNKGWNGTVNNGSNICQQDTYVYLIEATDNQGTQHKYIGKVTLLK